MTSNLTDLAAYRTKKAIKGDRKVGVQDTFDLKRPGRAPGEGSDLGTGSATPTPAGHSNHELGFAMDSGFTPSSSQALVERIERLKSSISRINALMDELRSGPNSPK
jgi:hypothetical protein